MSLFLDYPSPSIADTIYLQNTTYDRDSRWLLKGNNSSTERITLKAPNIIIHFKGRAYTFASSEILISSTIYWDSIATNYTVASNRAGKDFYIYAVVANPASADFEIRLSANDTTPIGFDTSNSVKIGGFHCLCVDVSTNDAPYTNSAQDLAVLNKWVPNHTLAANPNGHWLRGYLLGDILPFSIWDLIHRVNDNARQEGMRYVPQINRWVGIYLPSWHSASETLRSVYNQAVSSGTTNPAFHWYKATQQLTQQGESLLWQSQFTVASLGCPQGVNITDSVIPTGAGGHVATTGKRIISLTGGEDETGVFWQWGLDQGPGAATTWRDAYGGANVSETNVRGQNYQEGMMVPCF